MQKHSFYDQMEQILEHFSELEFYEQKKETQAFEILETQKMALGDGLDIIYSRRPNLIESFEESKQKPLIVMSKENSFIGVLSEVNFLYFGKNISAFYTSDLRMKSSASKKMKISFRPFYKEMIKNISRPCYSAVLKDNEKAINSLTKGKSGIYYHPLIDYVNLSIPILPTIKLMPISSKNLKLKYVSELPSTFLKTVLCHIDFSHDIHLGDVNFVVEKDQKIIGFFSITRPKRRSLKVKTSKRYLNLLMKTLKGIFNVDYSEKIPWVYMTNKVIKADINENQLLKFVLKKLLMDKKLQSAELFLCTSTQKELENLNIFAPKICTHGTFYEISMNPSRPRLLKQAHLNPMYL